MLQNSREALVWSDLLPPVGVPGIENWSSFEGRKYHSSPTTSGYSACMFSCNRLFEVEILRAQSPWPVLAPEARIERGALGRH